MLAVVIPSYKVKHQILGVLAAVGRSVDRIFVVDDACPEGSGRHVQEHCRDPRVEVLFHEQNLGVGGAVITGYRRALEVGAAYVVKLDGDGQMDPALVDRFVAPLARGEADYVKGNRFFQLETLQEMPRLRLLGNAGLSFISKVSSGYWDIMDPTNGYTAINAETLRRLPLHKIDRRYFFESDMLFRLNTIRAVVVDVPMEARYGDEKSSLKIGRVLFEFPRKHLVRFCKRVFYTYFLRDFNIGTVELLLALVLLTFSVVFGGYHWLESKRHGVVASAGTIMLAALPFLLGFQSLLAAVHYDLQNIPRVPLSRFTASAAPPRGGGPGNGRAGPPPPRAS